MPEKAPPFVPEFDPKDDPRRVFQQSERYYHFCRRLYERLTTESGEHFDGLPYVHIGGSIDFSPSVLAPVHRSNLDTPLVASIADHEGLDVVHFLAKHEMFYPAEIYAKKKFDPDTKVGRAAIKLATKLDFIPRTNAQLGGGYPVDRDHPDIEGVAMWAEKRLGSGQTIAMYPEATRVKENIEAIARPKPGPALMSILNRVPLYPIAYWGGHDLVLRKRGKDSKPMVVKIGEPLFPEDFVDYDTATDMDMQRAAIKMTRELKHRLQQDLDETREFSEDKL